MDKVNWISHLNDIGSVSGCFLSNELLDAFPVRLVEMDDELMEIYVSMDKDNFIEIKSSCSDNIKYYFKEFSIEPWKDFARGYRTEVNLMIRDWLREVSKKLSEGFVMTIDYGYPAWDYYSDERVGGTLLCYHKHKLNENPYENIGEQDITAHVNFSSLKKWGEELGLKTAGYCSQGTFLIALGIDKVITELYGNSPDYLFEVAKIKGLLLPQGMGESHKVMIQYKGEGSPELTGFSMRNQAGAL
jgi:SAM-dependent MidA family methyltransferase